MTGNDIQVLSSAEEFSKLFSKLDHCNEIEQKSQIEEINKIMNKMNCKEFDLILSTKWFDEVERMIGRKKLPLESVVVLLKHIGIYNVLNKNYECNFNHSSLRHRFKKIIVDEESKKERMNEKLLVDFCECYLFLYDSGKCFKKKLIKICVPCLFKVVLNIKEKKEAEKEVEMFLLSLSRIFNKQVVEQELYLGAIKEIIQYHQEHHNLTRLAYQSAWQFLINRLFTDKRLEDMIVNELHFGREASRELEELSKCVDWKREKAEEEEKEGRMNVKGVFIVRRWLNIINYCLSSWKLRNEGDFLLISSIVQVFREVKDYYENIIRQCIESFQWVERNFEMGVDILLKGGAIDVMLEETVELNVKSSRNFYWPFPFKEICENVKYQMIIKKKEAKRKEIKRKIFEKMEEVGYEDCVMGLHYCLIKGLYGHYFLISNPEDCFVYC